MKPLIYSSDAFLNQSLGNLGGALGQALGKYQNMQNQQQQSSALEQTLQNIPSGASQVQVLQSILGSGIPMDKALEIYKSYKPQETPRMSEKQQEKMISLNRAESTIASMKKLLEGGNIGSYLGVGIDPTRNFGKTGEDREKFVKFGQSLIPLVAAGVRINNQKEFQEYKSVITNPDATKAQLKGAISALEDMVRNELSLRNNPEQMSNMQSINNSNQMQQRPPLESFFKM
jgi:hypothetical protein